MYGDCKMSIRRNRRVSRVKLVNGSIPYIQLSKKFDAMATFEGHGKLAIILMSAAKDEHPNRKRNKVPVQSSHRRSSEYLEMTTVEGKVALSIHNAMNGLREWRHY